MRHSCDALPRLLQACVNAGVDQVELLNEESKQHCYTCNQANVCVVGCFVVEM